MTTVLSDASKRVRNRVDKKADYGRALSLRRETNAKGKEICDSSFSLEEEKEKG